MNSHSEFDSDPENSSKLSSSDSSSSDCSDSRSSEDSESDSSSCSSVLDNCRFPCGQTFLRERRPVGCKGTVNFIFEHPSSNSESELTDSYSLSS